MYEMGIHILLKLALHIGIISHLTKLERDSYRIKKTLSGMWLN